MILSRSVVPWLLNKHLYSASIVLHVKCINSDFAKKLSLSFSESDFLRKTEGKGIRVDRAPHQYQYPPCRDAECEWCSSLNLTLTGAIKTDTSGTRVYYF